MSKSGIQISFYHCQSSKLCIQWSVGSRYFSSYPPMLRLYLAYKRPTFHAQQSLNDHQTEFREIYRKLGREYSIFLEMLRMSYRCFSVQVTSPRVKYLSCGRYSPINKKYAIPGSLSSCSSISLSIEISALQWINSFSFLKHQILFQSYSFKSCIVSIHFIQRYHIHANKSLQYFRRSDWHIR